MLDFIFCFCFFFLPQKQKTKNQKKENENSPNNSYFLGHAKLRHLFLMIIDVFFLGCPPDCDWEIFLDICFPKFSVFPFGSHRVFFQFQSESECFAERVSRAFIQVQVEKFPNQFFIFFLVFFFVRTFWLSIVSIKILFEKEDDSYFQSFFGGFK